MTVWLGTVRQWHWISSAVCLVGLMLFAITGITLNNAALIEAKPAVSSLTTTLPETLQSELLEQLPNEGVPLKLAHWLDRELEVDVQGKEVEWNDTELYIALPRPGGDAWLSLELQSGEVEYEVTTRGLVAYFNDLHKGRHTGKAWSWFIDIFAGLCAVFSLSGLWLLARHANARPSTWPLVALGLVVPLVLAVLFIH